MTDSSTVAADLDADLPAIDRGLGAVVTARGRRAADLEPAAVGRLLERHGVLLFRGFTSKTEDFVAFSARLTEDFSNYRGGGLRFALLDRQSVDGMPTVMTTTGHTQSFAIPLHGEMYYLKEPPRLLWFYADIPPARAGETTIADGAALFAALRPETQAYFRETPVTYVRNLVDGDWQATFMTKDLDEARAFGAAQDLTMRHDPQTGTLSAEFTNSAIRMDRGRPIFINNLLFIWLAEKAFLSGWAQRNLPGLRSAACPMVVRAGDGAPLPDAVMADVKTCSEALTAKIGWQQGDIVLIDNHRMLHGRAETDGGIRSILVRMGAPAFDLRAVA